MKLLIHMDVEIRILLCKLFSEKKILYLLSDQTRKIFDNLYQARILCRDKLRSSTVEKTAAILWDRILSYEVIMKLSKHKIKRHPFITSIFVRFLITAKILEPLQETSQMKRYIKALRINLDLHHGRLAKLKE